MRRIAVLCALIAAALAGAAGPAGAAAKRPIVYVIVIDGLDGDRVDAGKAPFISSLLDGHGARATYFPESRSVLPAETNPNHTAMMSGAYPGDRASPPTVRALRAARERGLVRARPGRSTRAMPTPTSGENANCPQAQLVFEAVKRQGNPRRRSDRRDLRQAQARPDLRRARTCEPGRHDVDYLWAPCASGPTTTTTAGTCPTNPVTGYALDDTTVMDEVHRVRSTEGVGSGGKRRPDFTFVNLHQVDTRRPRDRHRRRLRRGDRAWPTTRSSAWSRSCASAASGSAPC